MGRKHGVGAVFCFAHRRLRNVERLHLRHVDAVRSQSQTVAERAHLQRGGGGRVQQVAHRPKSQRDLLPHLFRVQS